MNKTTIIIIVAIVIILLFVFAGSAFAANKKEQEPPQPTPGQEPGSLQDLVSQVLATGGDTSSCGKTCRTVCKKEKATLWPFDCGPRCQCKRSCKSDCAAGVNVAKEY